MTSILRTMVLVGLFSLLLGGCQSRAAALDSVTLRQLTPGVWLHTSGHTFANGAHYISNGLVVRDGEQLLLIDSAWGEGATRQLLALIKQQIGLPIKDAIITHFHDDRISGTPVLQAAGIRVWATPLTQQLAAAIGNPIPNHTLTKLAQPGDTTQIDGVEVLYPGAAHTRDNLMVWLPKQQLLYGGCAVRGNNWDSLGNIADANIKAWPATIKRVEALFPHIKTVVPGHGPVGKKQLLDHTLKLLQEQAAPE